MTNRMTIVERTDSRCYRSHIIIRENEGTWILAEFATVEQLDLFAKTLGFTYTVECYRSTEQNGIIREYRLSHKIDRGGYGCFWKMEDLPDGAKPIKALCNGSIVTCYFTNDGETIRFYRPNPNAHDIYKPLSIEEHIAHQRIYGSY